MSDIPLIIVLANKRLNIFHFTEIIDRSVEFDATQWKVTPAEIDTEYLFGEGAKLKDLNEQALWNKVLTGTYDLPGILQKTAQRYDLLVFLRQL